MKTAVMTVLGIIAGIMLGLGIGLKAMPLIPKLNLERNNIIYKITGTHKPIVMGFLPYWLLNKATNDYNKSMTDLAYFAVIINSDGTIVKTNDKNEEEPGWNKLKSSNLKQFLGNFKGERKVLVVQSGVEDSISDLIKDPKKHGEALAAEVIPLMKKYGFTDLNVDIESFRSGSEQDQNNFTELLKTIKEEMVKNEMGEVSIDLPVAAFSKETIIDPKGIQPYTDEMILMAYDYHYRGSMNTGAVAPLGGAGIDKEIDVETAVAAALKSFRPTQIVLGIPFYGYEWETISSNKESPIIPGSGLTDSHKTALDKISNCSNCNVSDDANSKEKVIIGEDSQTGSFHQIYFGDVNSIEEKISLAKKYKLGGLAFWALGYEDESLLKPLENYRNFYWQD
ncbi:MAG TPA: glycosyl hydrolase family 18 protein [Patescibacteria group bacterium]